MGEQGEVGSQNKIRALSQDEEEVRAAGTSLNKQPLPPQTSNGRRKENTRQEPSQVRPLRSTDVTVIRAGTSLMVSTSLAPQEPSAHFRGTRQEGFLPR